MSKLNLTDLANLQNENTAVAAINANNLAIENAIENTLSRDGTTPNQMSSNLDMNSYRIINLLAPVDSSEPIRKGDADDLYTRIQAALDALGGSLSNLVAVNFTTRAVAIATSISAIVPFIVTGGYASVGDGGGAIYFRSVDATRGGFQSLDGAFWRPDVSMHDVRVYGAKANDNTKGAVNAAAFALAFTNTPEVYAPAGNTFYCEEILVPTTATRLYGGANLIASGTIAGGQALVFVASNIAGFTIENLSLTVSFATYPTVSGLIVSSCNNTITKNLTTSGCQFAILLSGGSSNRITDCNINAYGTFGIYIQGSPSVVTLKNIMVSGSAAASSHAIVLNSVTWFDVEHCIITQSVGGGGIWVSLCTYGNITGNVVNNTKFEGIHTDSGNNITITSNTLSWFANSVEVAMSISSDNGPPAFYTTVVGNNINNPAFSGIYLVGAQRTTVSGNFIYNPNQLSGAGELGSAVLLDGTAASTLNNTITGNFFMSSDSKMHYGVAERTVGGNIPNANIIGDNACTNATVSKTLIVGSTSQVNVSVPLRGKTVAQLEPQSDAISGQRDFVTNATSQTFMATAVGGGAFRVPVVCLGAVNGWCVG